jgi:hypothetical protein
MVLNKSNQVSEVIETKSEFLGPRFNDTNVEGCLDHEPLSPSLVNSIRKGVRLRPIPSRIDYNFFNYCSTCELKYPKQILRCKDCNQKVRTRPWHRSKIIDRKRI